MIYTKAVGSLLLWTKLFYYVRMYKRTSYLVFSILNILVNLKSFLFIYVIIVLAFSDAFYTTSIYHETYLYTEGNKYYPNYLNCFIETMKYMMSIPGWLDNSQSVLAFLLFLLCTVVIFLMMLNLLIASVGSTFGEVQKT